MYMFHKILQMDVESCIARVLLGGSLWNVCEYKYPGPASALIGWSIVLYTKKVVGSISCQGTYLSFWLDPWWVGALKEAANQCFFFTPLSLSLPPHNQ